MFAKNTSEMGINSATEVLISESDRSSSFRIDFSLQIIIDLGLLSFSQGEHMKLLRVAAVVSVLCGPAAFAAETITYTYDALGRLTKVVHTGTVNNNVQAQYTIDKADNRTRIVVTGSPNPPP